MDAHEQNTTKYDTHQISMSADSLVMRIASLLIETPSITDQEIADQVGLGRQAVNRRRNSEPVKQLIQSILSIPKREIRRITAKALHRLEQLLDDPNPEIRLNSTIALTRLAPNLMTDDIEAALLKWGGVI